MIFPTLAYLLTGIVAMLVVLVFLWKDKHGLSYLLFFSMFWIYLLLVFSVIIFPIVPLSESYHETFRLRTNFIPFYFGACYIPRFCLRNIIGNILLTIPFGFGISFIVRLRLKDFIWLSPLVGFAFETIQLVLALVYRSSFRVIDINDVILNASGVWIGYFLFRIFGFLYLFVTERFEMSRGALFAYVYEVVRQSR